jgi:hypothetical protein
MRDDQNVVLSPSLARPSPVAVAPQPLAPLLAAPAADVGRGFRHHGSGKSTGSHPVDGQRLDLNQKPKQNPSLTEGNLGEGKRGGWRKEAGGGEAAAWAYLF